MAVILAMLLGAVPLAAQEPQCNIALSPDATAACNAAVDAVRAFYPLAGVIVNGGNPVLGTAGALGGFGHLAVTVRANAVKASLPDPSAASQRPVPSSFDGAVPAPMVEGAVGLLRSSYRRESTISPLAPTRLASATRRWGSAMAFASACSGAPSRCPRSR
ncbi:MAG: hypothetical protein DMD34_14065 [Gemmatimonadetes bacterium]|nr:MAG: hypothetical protein DMD34_14065 [Gemmatimonadota bacterium]